MKKLTMNNTNIIRRHNLMAKCLTEILSLSQKGIEEADKELKKFNDKDTSLLSNWFSDGYAAAKKGLFGTLTLLIEDSLDDLIVDGKIEEIDNIEPSGFDISHCVDKSMAGQKFSLVTTESDKVKYFMFDENGNIHEIEHEDYLKLPKQEDVPVIKLDPPTGKLFYGNDFSITTSNDKWSHPNNISKFN